MTVLTVLRHAKSSWGDAGLDDFDRPLNDRGRKAAGRVGREFRRRRVRFDQVIASPALRVRETLAELADGYGDSFDICFDPQIYAASAQTLFDLVRRIPATIHAPLLVGHNPGLQQLVLKLTRGDRQGLRARVADKFPTASVTLIELPALSWDDVEPDSGVIGELILPRDLD